MSNHNFRELDPPTYSRQFHANCGKIQYVSDPFRKKSISNGWQVISLLYRKVSQNWNFLNIIWFIEHLKALNERISECAYFLNLVKRIPRYLNFTALIRSFFWTRHPSMIPDNFDWDSLFLFFPWISGSFVLILFLRQLSTSKKGVKVGGWG